MSKSFSTGAAPGPLNTAPGAGKLISPLNLLVIRSAVLFAQDLIDVLFRLRLDRLRDGGGAHHRAGGIRQLLGTKAFCQRWVPQLSWQKALHKA